MTRARTRPSGDSRRRSNARAGTWARKAACLTQAELSARAFVQQAEISRIERGLGNPTRDTLLRLALAMGTRLVLIPDDVVAQA